MPRVFNKVKEEIAVNPFALAIQEIKSHASMNVKTEEVGSSEIVDIIKFCEGEQYLNLPANKLKWNGNGYTPMRKRKHLKIMFILEI